MWAVGGVLVGLFSLALVVTIALGPAGGKSAAYEEGYSFGNANWDQTTEDVLCDFTAQSQLASGNMGLDEMADWTEGCHDGYSDKVR